MATGSTITKSIHSTLQETLCLPVCFFAEKKKKSVRGNFIGFVFRGFKDGDNVYTRQRDGKMWRWNEGIYSSLDLLSSMTYIYPPPVATPPPPPYWPFSFLYL